MKRLLLPLLLSLILCACTNASPATGPQSSGADPALEEPATDESAIEAGEPEAPTLPPYPTAEDVPYSSRYENLLQDSPFNQLMLHNPIDNCPVIVWEQRDGILSRGLELEATAWKAEMRNAYELALSHSSPEAAVYLTEAQQAFETWVVNDAWHYGRQYEELYGRASITTISHHASLGRHYRERAIDLIDLYMTITGEVYEFLYLCPEQ